MVLKKDIAQLAKELRDIPAWRPAAEIAVHWLVLLAIIAAAVHFNIWWVYGLAMLAIGAQQYALLILLHDAQHSLLHPSKHINNRLATWLIAVPCITEFERSQKRHLAHHQFFGSAEEDPDYPLYTTLPPHAKKTRAQLVRHFSRRITGNKFASAVTQEKQQHRWRPAIIMQAVIFALFSATAGWEFYFLL